jgi:hypothetical protein
MHRYSAHRRRSLRNHHHNDCYTQSIPFIHISDNNNFCKHSHLLDSIQTQVLVTGNIRAIRVSAAIIVVSVVIATIRPSVLSIRRPVIVIRGADLSFN